MAENQELFNTPKTLEIKNYIYSYKCQLVNDYFSYRYKYRKNCQMLIKVTKEELKKYNQDNSNELKFEITSKIKEYTCKNKIVENKDSKANDEIKKNIKKNN